MKPNQLFVGIAAFACLSSSPARAVTLFGDVNHSDTLPPAQVQQRPAPNVVPERSVS